MSKKRVRISRSILNHLSYQLLTVHKCIFGVSKQNLAKIPQSSGSRVNFVNAMGSGEGGDGSSNGLGLARGAGQWDVLSCCTGVRLCSAERQFCKTEIGSRPQRLSPPRVVWCPSERPQKDHQRQSHWKDHSWLEGSISFSFHFLNKNP